MSLIPDRENDAFTERAESWLRKNADDELRPKFSGTDDEFRVAIDTMVFNVLDAYFDLVKYPEPCPWCTRSGRDHDDECPLVMWDDAYCETLARLNPHLAEEFRKRRPSARITIDAGIAYGRRLHAD